MKISAFATTMLAASSTAFVIPDEIKEYIRLFDSAVLVGIWEEMWEVIAFTYVRDMFCSQFALTGWPDIIGAALGGFTEADVTNAFTAGGANV